ncbi:unnamed protein product [Calypogeia fissa]
MKSSTSQKVMEQDAPDNVDLMHNEKRKSSASTLPAKRRRLVMESDSEVESDEDCIILGRSLPSMQRWTSEDRQYKGEHKFEDIAEVYGGELDRLGEIDIDVVDDDDDLGDSHFYAICDDGGQLLWRHDIIEEFVTPTKDHIKWPEVPSLTLH